MTLVNFRKISKRREIKNEKFKIGRIMLEHIE